MKKYIALFFFFCLCKPAVCMAYSVLTHEAIIDACWKISIEPLLKKKYPGATDEQLKEAHAYAYGGAVAPDMGYFPFGSRLFTNLVHYVRSGDFVIALLTEAQNIDEYALHSAHYLITMRVVNVKHKEIVKSVKNCLIY